MTKQQRRAIYKFYRDAGYSANEARNMRNRPLKVWDDFTALDTEIRRSRRGIPRHKKPLLPKPPKVPLSKSYRKRMKQRLIDRYGINRELAHQWSRLSDRNLSKRLSNMDKFLEALSEKGRLPWWTSIKEFKKAIRNARTTKEFFDVFQDFYLSYVGLTTAYDDKNVANTVSKTAHKKTV